MIKNTILKRTIGKIDPVVFLLNRSQRLPISLRSSFVESKNNVVEYPLPEAVLPKNVLLDDYKNKERRPLKLPVLEDIYQHIKITYPLLNFKRTLFICGQHLLSTTIDLFEFYIQLGAIPPNIYVTGKSYSNSPEVIKQLQFMGIQYQKNAEQEELGEFEPLYEADIHDMIQRVVNRLEHEKNQPSIDFIIAPDDGGHVLTGIRRNKALRKLCPHIIGIEQTSSGIIASTQTSYPVIELATSAVKRLVEPPMIADRVAANVVHQLTRLTGLSDTDRKTTVLHSIQSFSKLHSLPVCLIIGAGYIGEAVLNKLTLCGLIHFIIFDKDIRKTEQLMKKYKKQFPDLTLETGNTLPPLIQKAHLIGSCTGTDITNNPEIIEAIETKNTPLILFSCGSKDKEGATLLRHLQLKHLTRKAKAGSINPLDNQLFHGKNGNPILLLRGLFPLNFDNSPESVPGRYIQVIRGLKAMATVQAYEILLEAKKQGVISSPKNYQLNIDAQAFVVKLFAKHEPEKMKRYSSVIQKKLNNLKNLEEESGGIAFRL